MNTSRLLKTAAFGAAIVTLTAGTAMAAVASNAVNVRSGPGTSYSVLDVLHRGEAVNVIDRDGSWCEVEKSGPNGWVACNYLVSSNAYDDEDEYYDDGGSYDDSPSVGVQFGFGNRPMRPYHGWYHDHPSSGFSFSYSN